MSSGSVLDDSGSVSSSSGASMQNDEHGDPGVTCRAETTRSKRVAHAEARNIRVAMMILKSGMGYSMTQIVVSKV